jgi:hypothetical protein
MMLNGRCFGPLLIKSHDFTIRFTRIRWAIGRVIYHAIQTQYGRVQTDFNRNVRDMLLILNDY